MKKNIKKLEPMPTITAENELEKVEIVTRIFHRMSLVSLRNLDKMLFPETKTCEPIKSD